MNFSTKVCFALTALLGLLSIVSRADQLDTFTNVQASSSAEIFYTNKNVYRGRLIGSNSEENSIVELYGYPQRYTVPKASLTFSSSCAGIFCAGDRAANIKFGASMATVLGANPETGKVTLLFDSFREQLYTYDAANLTKAVGKGEQMKVFHTAFNASGGTVVASNAATKKVTVRFDNNANLFTYGRDELTYAQGCINKICVGLAVKEFRNSHLAATVVGVNPASSKITAYFPALQAYYTYPAEAFSPPAVNVY